MHLLDDVKDLTLDLRDNFINDISKKLLNFLNQKLNYIKRLDQIKTCLNDLKRKGYKLETLNQLYQIVLYTNNTQKIPDNANIPQTKNSPNNLLKFALKNSAKNSKDIKLHDVKPILEYSQETYNKDGSYSLDQRIRSHSVISNHKKPFSKIDAEEYISMIFSNLKKKVRTNSSCEKLYRTNDLQKDERLNTSCTLDYSLNIYYKTKSKIRHSLSMIRFDIKIDSEDTSSKISKIDVNDFQIIKGLSSGAYGKVCLVKKRSSGDYFAMKIIDKEITAEKSQEDYIRSEVTIMRNVNSDYIVKLYYSFQNDRYLFFVMEYMNGGDLGNILQIFGCLEEKV